MPPSFAEQEYWDTRFSNDKAAFDWLLPSSLVCDIVARTIDDASLTDPRVLHIGCGTSDLSSRLRTLVKDGTDVCNVDFSQPAVEAGRATEADVAAAEWGGGGIEHQGNKLADHMRWSQADLLSLPDVKSLLDEEYHNECLYNVVVDKSTSDAISCGEDVEVQLPYALGVHADSQISRKEERLVVSGVHPLHILAVHLAALTQPVTGRWIAISYTDDRFPFLSSYTKSQADGLLDESTVGMCFPHPSRLWRLEKKWQVKAVVQPSAEGDSGNIVHTPEIFHWVYILARTEVPLTMPLISGR